MAKIKIDNKTQNTIFLEGYAFLPGITETQDLSKAEETKIKKLLDRPTMKERIEKGLIILNPKEEAAAGTKEEQKELM